MAGSSISVGKAIPAGIWVLGFVSLLMDVSSEMIHALLPIYLVTVLGTSALTVGVIEGIAEATASITKIFSGALSRLARQAEIPGCARLWPGGLDQADLPAGDARSAGWSPHVSSTASARASAAPRAMRSSPTSRPPDLRGASFGLRQSLDTVGAFLGPLLAILVMWLSPTTSRRCSGSRSFPASCRSA